MINFSTGATRPERFEINRWRTEINVYDQDGQQMANAPIRLSAQSAVDVEINGAYFVIDSAISAAGNLLLDVSGDLNANAAIDRKSVV